MEIPGIWWYKCRTSKELDRSLITLSVAYIFKKYINGKNIPQEWKVAYIIPTYKKGNKLDNNNYRGISLASTISGVYGRIIKDKIENKYKDYEEVKQCGFRTGRSCTDKVFCLKQVIEKS